MLTLLEVFDQLGQAAWHHVWVPVLAWTILVLPIWVCLEWTDHLHPYAEYRLSQVLLASLPGGVIAVGFFNLMPATPSIAHVPEVSIAVLPPLEVSETETSSTSLWTWTHAVGIFSAVAIAASLFGLGRLALDALAAIRVSKIHDDAHLDSIQEQADRLSETLHVNRQVRTCLASEAAVPMTLGGTQPTILLPPALADAPDALRMTLVHEYIHIRRYDDVAHLAERVVAALFVVHPFVHRLRQSIAEARERACDAAVLGHDHASRSAYARLLASFAEGTPPNRLGALSLSESPSSLTNRLAAMQSSISGWLSSPFALGMTTLGIGLALSLGVVACSDGVTPSPDASTEPASTVKSSDADASNSTLNDEEVFMVVEDQPELIGGMEALQNEITYPELAKEAGIEGRVFVQFVVDKEGTVREPKITRSVHELVDEAAIKAVEEMEFEPGKQRGEPVNVQMALPVTFKLPESPTTSDASDPEGQIQAPDTPEDSPQIKGGLQALQEQISYPDLVRKAGIEGTVLVTFTVDETGEVQQPRITEGVHEALDAAALEAVKRVSFTPAEKNGKPVATEMTLPITFKLPAEQG